MAIRRLVLATLACAAVGAADQSSSSGSAPAMDAAAMERMRPGPEHQQLAALAGTWQTTGKFWMAPDTPPTESSGTSTMTMIMDGRFLRESHQGAFMGQPFTGEATVGFDRTAQQHVVTWIDSMGTGMITMRSAAGGDGKTITYRGDMACPMDGKTYAVRETFTVESNDRLRMEMFQTRDGKEWKSMEMTYTRAK